MDLLSIVEHLKEKFSIMSELLTSLPEIVKLEKKYHKSLRYHATHSKLDGPGHHSLVHSAAWTFCLIDLLFVFYGRKNIMRLIVQDIFNEK